MRGHVLLSQSSGTLVKSTKCGYSRKPHTTRQGCRGEQRGGCQTEASIFDAMAQLPLLKRSNVVNGGTQKPLLEAQRRRDESIKQLVQLGQLGPDKLQGVGSEANTQCKT